MTIVVVPDETDRNGDPRYYKAIVVKDGRQWAGYGTCERSAIRVALRKYRRDMRHWKRRHRSVAA